MRYTTGQAPPDLASLRVALNAAEPVRKTTVRDFESMFGLERVMTVGYGLAEATVGVSMTKPGGIVQVDPDGFASCGRPFPRVELRILKPDGALGTVGETGEILVRSPANTQGYFNDPDAGRRLFWDAGFIRTGDIGYLDRDGELYVIGRSKDMLKHAGRTYAPREIEAALDDVPGVRRAVAVSADLGGLPGEQIILFCEIEKSGRLDQDSLHALTVDLVARVHAHAGLRPGRLYLVRPKTVPLSPNGKVQRSRLRTAFLDGRLRASARIVYPDF